MRIEILGTGCYNCLQLETLVNEVCLELGRKDVEVVRLNDEITIRKFMPPDEIPGPVIDGHLVSTRTVPDRETLVEWLSEARQPAGA
jgi:hypothetical protein